jgi:hypothetical protein
LILEDRDDEKLRFRATDELRAAVETARNRKKGTWPR